MTASRIDLVRLTAKISDIEECLGILRGYAGYVDEQFLENAEAVRSARYTFIVLVEAAVNIAMHLCARLLRQAPATYAESFEMLAEHGFLPAELARRLAQMVGFRNLLVHGYEKIDDRRMLKVTREDLGDLELYLAAIREVLAREKGNHGQRR